MNDVTWGELEAQRAELLPARETLYFGGIDINAVLNAAAVSATNFSQAANVLTEGSDAESAADQYIDIDQG